MKKIITENELSHIAELSKLDIGDTKSQKLIEDLENMIEFAEQISAAEVSVTQKETTRLFCLSELRDDTPGPSLTREKTLSYAPTHTDLYITVPAVIEELI